MLILSLAPVNARNSFYNLLDRSDFLIFLFIILVRQVYEPIGCILGSFLGIGVTLLSWFPEN